MSSVDSAENAWWPRSEVERQQVRKQLNRVLQSPGFQNSRRYPNLLRFIVEQALEGKAEALKERLLGIEVFHRAPDYDTNQDPVVRLSAAEVRKRLAVYYQNPAHENELGIGLNPGSYIPVFRLPRLAEAPSAPTLTEAIPLPGPAAKVNPRRPWRLAAGIAAGLIAATCLGVYLLHRPSAVDQFWSPVFSSPFRVILCVGSPDAVNGPAQASTTPSTIQEDLLHSGRLSIANVATLTHIGGVLDDHHKTYRIALASQASFPELREGPVVLVGALDNSWTMHLTQSLRFGFAMDADELYIVDRKNPTARNWTVSLKQTPTSQAEDFAIIARYHDSALDQPVVLAAGLSREGTEAAGELLSNPGFLKSLLGNAPGNWKTVNLEAVVQTQVIAGHPGASRVLAVEYW